MLFFEFSFRYTHITSKHYTVFIPCAADFSQRSPSNTTIYRIYSTIYIIVCQYPFIIKYHKIRVDRRKFVCNTEDYRMSHDEILRKIVQLRIDKNWSEYRLSMETGIPQSTISAFCAITRRHLSGLRNHAVPVFFVRRRFDGWVDRWTEGFFRSVFRFTFGTAKSLDCFLAHAESRPHRIKSLPHCGSSLFPRTGFLSDFRVFSEEKLKKEV